MGSLLAGAKVLSSPLPPLRREEGKCLRPSRTTLLFCWPGGGEDPYLRPCGRVAGAKYIFGPPAPMREVRRCFLRPACARGEAKICFAPLAGRCEDIFFASFVSFALLAAILSRAKKSTSHLSAPRRGEGNLLRTDCVLTYAEVKISKSCGPCEDIASSPLSLAGRAKFLPSHMRRFHLRLSRLAAGAKCNSSHVSFLIRAKCEVTVFALGTALQGRR